MNWWEEIWHAIEAWILHEKHDKPPKPPKPDKHRLHSIEVRLRRVKHHKPHPHPHPVHP